MSQQLSPRLTWKPRAWKQELEWLLGVLQGLPYKASLRWSQYRIMEQFHVDKKVFPTLAQSISKARKTGWKGWHPDILNDSVRTVNYRGTGCETFQEYKKRIADLNPPVDVWGSLPFYAEVWYEAEAMTGQFTHYLTPFQITSRALRGDYSIPMKWKAAKDIEREADGRRRVLILYFGDYDPKGESIPEAALKDVKDWADSEFEFYRVGLNKEQVEEFNLPENPERPGQWQWEGLSDEQARTIIEQGLALLPRGLNDAIAKAKKEQAEWKKQLARILGS